MSARIALIAGANGLVGGECLRRLLEHPDYGRVIALLRRPLSVTNARLEQRIVDFDRLDFDPTPGADVFCALGTTIHKAGSQAAFRAVDYGYVKALAERTAAAGAGQFVLVSAVDANPRSGNFYLRVKGEIEESVSALPFASVHCFRPSFLLGEREEQRFGERIGTTLARSVAFALVGRLRRYRPIAAATVGAAMVRAAASARLGTHIYHYDEIRALTGTPEPRA